MATDEEYLDGLLKSLMDLDPEPGEEESVPEETSIEEVISGVNDLEEAVLAEAAEEEEKAQTGQKMQEQIMQEEKVQTEPVMQEPARQEVQQAVEEAQEQIPQEAEAEIAKASEKAMETVVEEPAAEEVTPAEMDDEAWEAGLNDLLSAAIADIEQITDPNIEQNTEQNAEQDADSGQDVDVTQMIDEMADADEDLNEINELFKQSDSGEGIKVDMSELLDSIKDGKQEKKEGKSKKKKKFQFPWKKKGKKDPESEPDEEGLTDIGSIDFAGGADLEEDGAENQADPASRPKEVSLKDVTKEKGSKKDKKSSGQDKPGLFKRFLEFLLAEEEEEEEDKPVRKDSDEDLFKQLGGGEKSAPAKKDQKKEKKAKKENKKEKKEKKPKEKKKKEPKPKVEKVKEKEKPSKPIGKMNLILVTLFSLTIMAVVLLLTTALTNFAIRNDAKNAFESGDYEEAYQLLYGRKLDEEQEQIFKRVELVLQIERKLDNYNYYKEAGDAARALDALLQAADRYSEVRGADTYGAGEELLRLYQVILEHLNLDYGVSEEMAFEINACEENKDYSKRIYDIVNGTGFEDSPSEETQEPEDGVRDILPEEEDIIDKGV